jgi:peptidyl-tRNA hydrolase
MVLRVEKVNPPTHLEAVLTVAEAIAHLYEDSITVSDKVWVDAIEAWSRGRIRKIARRARANAWEVAKTTPHAFLYEKDFAGKKVEVLLFPPHPVSEVPDTIRKLQVAGLDLEKVEVPKLVKSGLNIAFTPLVDMTTGKALAQVGHAVQLAILNSTVEQVKTWRDQGMPIAIVDWGSLPNASVEVQDAGFTEVPPGTTTVKATFV